MIAYSLGQAREVLRLLTAREPPPGAAKHTLTIDGGGQLVLSIMFAGRWLSFTLEEADLAKSPEQLVGEVVAMIPPELRA